MRLLLVPHAPTEWSAAGRFQGWSDPPLSEEGNGQANQLRQRLGREAIDFCHASDLRRAQETATVICEPAAGGSIVLDSRLREMSFGSWEGLTYEEIRRSSLTTLSAWERDPMEVAPPGGERLAQVADRLGAFLTSITQPEEGRSRTGLVVGHRGALRVLICLALGLSPGAWRRFHLQPASISELSFFPRGAVLLSLNDTHHLREGSHAG